MSKVKKVSLFIILFIVSTFLSGCVNKTTDYKGVERKVEYGLVEIGSVSGDGQFTVCYDPTTMVCYMKIWSTYRLAISPYYIIGEDGQPEIAVYGVNYQYEHE